jgi:hypothetical protein
MGSGSPNPGIGSRRARVPRPGGRMISHAFKTPILDAPPWAPSTAIGRGPIGCWRRGAVADRPGWRPRRKAGPNRDASARHGVGPTGLGNQSASHDARGPRLDSMHGGGPDPVEPPADWSGRGGPADRDAPVRAPGRPRQRPPGPRLDTPKGQSCVASKGDWPTTTTECLHPPVRGRHGEGGYAVWRPRPHPQPAARHALRRRLPPRASVQAVQCSCTRTDFPSPPACVGARLARSIARVQEPETGSEPFPL